jgi:hypothetical protein
VTARKPGWIGYFDLLSAVLDYKHRHAFIHHPACLPAYGKAVPTPSHSRIRAWHGYGLTKPAPDR